MTVSAYHPDRSIEGKTLSQVAESRHAPEFETAVELLQRTDGLVRMVYHSLETADPPVFREMDDFHDAAPAGRALASKSRRTTASISRARWS